MTTNLIARKPFYTTAAYYLSFICLGMATAVLGPTLQGLAKNSDSTLAQISSLFLVTSFGYLLGSFASGRIYDRVKGHPIMSASLLIIVSILVIVPLMEKLFFLQVLFFVVGIVEGFLDVGINALIVWLHGDRVPPFMNGLHAAYGIGTTLAPLIVAAVLGGAGSMTSIYWSLAFLILPIGLLIPFFPSPSHLLSMQHAFDRPAAPILVFLISAIFFTFTGAEIGFGGWIFTYTTLQEYANPSQAASLNAAFWAALTVGRLVSIPLVVKLKPQRILWVDFFGIVASLLFVIFCSSSEPLLWIGSIGTGFFMGPVFPTLLNDAQSRMHLSGNVTGVFLAAGSLGTMILPWLMGQVITPFGATASMVIVLGSTLLATVTFHILNVKQQRMLAHPPQ